jgi:hypothetical protein
MKTVLVCTLWLVACGSQDAMPLGTPPVGNSPQPAPLAIAACPTATAQLAPGAAGTVSVTLAPIMVSTSATDICLHLDTTGLSRAHFAVATDVRVAGIVSPLTLSLLHLDGTLLVAGWDVTVGQQAPYTWPDLEWSPAAGRQFDVMLRVTARGQSLPAVLTLTLMDPLEA